MHFVVTRDDHSSFAETKCVTYLEGGAISVTVALKVEGVKIETCA